MSETQTPEQQMQALLDGMKGLSAKRNAEIMTEFVKHLPGEVSALVVTGAAVTVETVEVYGLEIELDANGRAGRVAVAGLRGTANNTMDTLDVEYYER